MRRKKYWCLIGLGGWVLLAIGCSANESTRTTTGPTRLDSVATQVIDSVTKFSSGSAATRPVSQTR